MSAAQHRGTSNTNTVWEHARTHARTHDRRLLVYALGSVLLVNVGIWALYHLLGLGSPGNMKADWNSFLHVRTWTDSWLPMLKSLDYFRDHPTKPIYYAKLYDTLIYPLPSLFPMMLVRRLGLGAHELRVLAWTSWLAVVGVLVAVIAIARQELRRRGGSLSVATVVGLTVLWAGFYPLFKGYGLGNASTFLTLAFAVLTWLWSRDNQRSSGVVLAAMVMVKPQFVLLVLWFALRKKWGALLSAVAFAAVMFAISFAVFGVHNNLDYLKVLSSLSHKAQSHYGNQSMFGTLNRMTFHGENLPYHPFVYSPHIPWIYNVTVATSLLLTALGLFFPWGKLKGSAGDMGAMAILSVAASPMAWEHHYGLVFPVLAWTWFAYGCWQQRVPWLLALSALLTMNALTPIHQFLSMHAGWNILQSYIYIGALLLVFLLMRLARTESAGAPTRL